MVAKEVVTAPEVQQLLVNTLDVELERKRATRVLCVGSEQTIT
ncbi:hypothetical protein PC129_g22123 [Phytophthora cactorum]|uniref:Uncharacterized protein n=1 Tax=Phytophthora cactorum TaxID=29920 RepID=A0A8T0Y1P9_9STRA|nr:hypothetical protein PC111_g22231 [Phytophthora cactorum]KAG2795559.1 hypothetical protein PC112_g22586 [Phytophthora cactorum]KAG2821510.1 hypothetical protein PC113_g22467 [Phytophthora cactorum]KAG2874517.1 hypothetical protein PC114_g25231 [Phytophthora cactorum]KAG2880614.1 hypothetical protein PC115_g22466 [Phytophthora cactorum]